MINQHMERIPFPLLRGSSKGNQEPALISKRRVYTYTEYSQQVQMFAVHLKWSGLQHGDRLGMYLPNQVEYAFLIMACLANGIVACPISTRYSVAQGLALARTIHCNALVIQNPEPAQATFKDIEFLPLADLPGSDATAAAEHLPESVSPSLPATLLFTSGSTGTPKAALLSYGNHYFSALGANHNLPFGPGDRWLLSLPLYHVGGLAILFRAALGGGAVVFPENPGDLAGAIAKFRVTHVSLVATQLYRLLQDPAAAKPLAQLKAILIGGSAIPKALIDRAVELGLPIHTTYGLTEMASQVTTTPPGASREMLATSGRCLPHRQLDISPEGEIRVKGRTRFLGYVDGEKLMQPFDAQGWFATGDLGYVDGQGNLIVVGRKDNLFISGGENIQPEEIEQALLQHPGILQAVVVPVPDPEFGQRPVAFVQMADGPKPHPGRLEAFLQDRLPRFKIPDAFLPWPASLQHTGLKAGRPALARLAAQRLRDESAEE